MTKNRRRIIVTLDDKIDAWLSEQKWEFNFSKFVRNLIHNHIDGDESA